MSEIATLVLGLAVLATQYLTGSPDAAFLGQLNGQSFVQMEGRLSDCAAAVRCDEDLQLNAATLAALAEQVENADPFAVDAAFYLLRGSDSLDVWHFLVEPVAELAERDPRLLLAELAKHRITNERMGNWVVQRSDDYVDEPALTVELYDRRLAALEAVSQAGTAELISTLSSALRTERA